MMMVGVVVAVVGCTAVVVLLAGHRPHQAPTAAAASTVAQPLGPAVALSAVTSPGAPSAVATPAQPGRTAPVEPLTYTVKAGDSLSSIAAWFHLQGYGTLYDANKAVIGANPSLIHPGQVITVSAQGITVG